MQTGDAEPWLWSRGKPCGLNSEHCPPEFPKLRKPVFRQGTVEMFWFFSFPLQIYGERGSEMKHMCKARSLWTVCFNFLNP